MSAGLIVDTAERRYGGARAVDGVSLRTPERGVLALLGASGSGKSTLLRLMAGLEPLDGGTIHLNGRLVSRPGFTEAPERRRVGLVFQDYALFPHMTAAQNVAFGLAGRPAEDRRRQSLTWLDRVGLAARAQAYPHELSGGEQQRVALARALAPDPAAVLLDEPFSGLDPVLRSDLRDLTRSIAADAQTAFVFVTHDAQEALYMADRLGVMALGRLVQEDSPQTVYARPASLAAAAALGPLNTFAGVVKAGVVDTPFATFPAPQCSEGVKALAAVRLEALSVSPGRTFILDERRPQGREDLVFIQCESSGVRWRALIPAATPAMTRCEVSVAPGAGFVFAL